MKSNCCKDCVAPKRHSTCHSTCKEYQEERKRNAERKAWEKEQQYRINNFDFDFNGAFRGKHCKGIKRVF